MVLRSRDRAASSEKRNDADDCACCLKSNVRFDSHVERRGIPSPQIPGVSDGADRVQTAQPPRRAAMYCASALQNLSKAPTSGSIDSIQALYAQHLRRMQARVALNPSRAKVGECTVLAYSEVGPLLYPQPRTAMLQCGKPSVAKHILRQY
jgi:hypothetical protein